eukprot:TRINITY_DN11941_c0_g1_i1.p1 TRINITY_DN11941_c0_g1~~TRINITY_DN11941_c0_g1_i1.p1  ORF type:complete len:168 (-),score=36.07 TRINITY_DN11941_c0_g1_i1:189-692(-)
MRRASVCGVALCILLAWTMVFDISHASRSLKRAKVAKPKVQVAQRPKATVNSAAGSSQQSKFKISTKTSSMVAQVEATIQPGEIWFGGKSIGPSDLVVVRGSPSVSIKVCRISAGQSGSSERCESFLPENEVRLKSMDWRSKDSDGIQVSAPVDTSIATSSDRIYIG